VDDSEHGVGATLTHRKAKQMVAVLAIAIAGVMLAVLAVLLGVARMVGGRK